MQPEDIAKFRIKYPKITKLFEIINNLVSKNLVRFLLLPIIYALPVFFINSRACHQLSQMIVEAK